MVRLLYQTLYQPETWANFSGKIYEYYQDVVQASGSNLTLTTRSAQAPPELKRQSSGQDWVDYTFQAITCGDSIDESNITTRAVFDELIRVVKDVSPMCEWGLY